MRRLISAGLAVALVLAAAPPAIGVLRNLPWGHGEAASSALTCTVRSGACDDGETAVFRMSGSAPPANAHAGTEGGSPSYGNIVCCSGVTGLGTSCSGNYDTVLWLSAPDNAHVSETGGDPYDTQVCLSASTDVIDCEYAGSCGAGACLAAISGPTNAHVADCDGTGDYATKVCCSAGAAPPVGGIAELPDLTSSASETAPSRGNYLPSLGGAAAVGALFLVAFGGWYARRRQLR